MADASKIDLYGEEINFKDAQARTDISNVKGDIAKIKAEVPVLAYESETETINVTKGINVLMQKLSIKEIEDGISK